MLQTQHKAYYSPSAEMRAFQPATSVSRRRCWVKKSIRPCKQDKLCWADKSIVSGQERSGAKSKSRASDLPEQQCNWSEMLNVPPGLFGQSGREILLLCMMAGAAWRTPGGARGTWRFGCVDCQWSCAVAMNFWRGSHCPPELFNQNQILLAGFFSDLLVAS